MNSADVRAQLVYALRGTPARPSRPCSGRRSESEPDAGHSSGDR